MNILLVNYVILYSVKLPVNFDEDDSNLTHEQCRFLLKKYMPPHVSDNKILQHLFIKYVHH